MSTDTTVPVTAVESFTPDLPRRYFRHSHELASFGGAISRLTLSLVFYSRPVEDTTAPALYTSNLFRFAVGVKLNLQKQLLISTDGIGLVDGDGSLVPFEGSSVMMAQDHSGRELSRNSDGSYTLLLSGGVSEIYDAGGRLLRICRKGNTGTGSSVLLEYTYSVVQGAEVLTRITDAFSRKILLSYAATESGALLVSAIALQDAVGTVKWQASVSYQFNGGNVAALLLGCGDVNTIYRFQNTQTFVMTKPASDTSPEAEGYYSLSRFRFSADRSACTLTNIRRGRTVSEVTYRYLIPMADRVDTYTLIETKDKNGVINRTQYNSRQEAEYTYEYSRTSDDDEESAFDSVSYYLPTFSSTVRMLTDKVFGALPMRTGQRFIPVSGIENAYECTNISFEKGSNYYLVTGWIRHPSETLRTVSLIIHMPLSTDTRYVSCDLCGNRWFFFSTLLEVTVPEEHLSGSFRLWIADDSLSVGTQLRDLRLVSVNRDMVFNGRPYLRPSAADDSLPERIYLEELDTLRASRGGQEVSLGTSGLTDADMTQYYIRKAMNGTAPCTFYRNRLLTAEPDLTDICLPYDGAYYSLDLFDLAYDRVSDDLHVCCHTHCSTPLAGSVATHNCLVRQTQDMTCHNMRRIYYREYDCHGDLIYTGVISDTGEEEFGTHYRRNFFGAVTQEITTDGTHIMRKSSVYSEDCDSLLRTTDATGSTTVFRSDPFWGVTTETDNAAGETSVAEYDRYAASPLRFVFRKADESTANGLVYDAEGFVTGLLQDDLAYRFGYAADRLSSVSAGTQTAAAAVRQYSYAEDSGNRTEATCYPPFAADDRAYITYDKYDRPVEYGTGTTPELRLRYGSYILGGTIDTPVVHAESGLMDATDLLAGTTSKYLYPYENDYVHGPVSAIVTSDTATGEELRRDSFTYDAKERMTVHEYRESGTGGLLHRTAVTYATDEHMPDADQRIASVTDTVNGTEVYRSEMEYDTFRRATTIRGLSGNHTVRTDIGYRSEETTDDYGMYRLTDGLPALATQTVFAEQSETGTLLHRYVPEFVSGRLSACTDTADSTARRTVYTYDAFGRIAREDNPDIYATLTYQYDAYGNLTSVKKYSYTTGTLPASPNSQETFVYADASRHDRMTTCLGEAVTYDSYGRMTGYNGIRYRWKNERLTGFSSGTLKNGTSSTTYTYDSQGRISKKVYSYLPGLSSVPLRYLSERTTVSTYDGSGRLLCERIDSVFMEDSVGTTETDRITYFYGENGIAGCLFCHNSEAPATFRYVRDLFGNITELLNADGQTVATYRYDAWGNCTILRNSSLDPRSFATLNPFRYRGYYYDTDLACYRCGTRCYNPLWRRWISPDSPDYLDYASANGLNLYLYCGNDPVNCKQEAVSSGVFSSSTDALLLSSETIDNDFRSFGTAPDGLNAVLATGSFQYGVFSGTGTITRMYVKDHVRLQLSSNTKRIKFTAGSFEKVSLFNAEGKIKIGNDAVDFTLAGIGDVGTMTVMAGLIVPKKKTYFVGVQTEAAMFSVRAGVQFRVCDVQIEIGGSMNALSLGLQFGIGFDKDGFYMVKGLSHLFGYSIYIRANFT